MKSIEMNWLVLAIAPGVAISTFIICKDKYNIEPKRHLLISFLLGIVSVFPAMIIESAFSIVDEGPFFHTIQGVGIKAFFMIALVEEICKFYMLRYYAYKKTAFDEPFDGIVYAVMVGMGFATLENIFYVYHYGTGTGIMRMLLAVPAHATFAIIMGYFMGKAKFSKNNEKLLIGYGIIGAVTFHGSYDMFLMLLENEMILKYSSSLLLFMGALISLITGLILSNKAIKEHLIISKNNHIDEFEHHEN